MKANIFPLTANLEEKKQANQFYVFGLLQPISHAIYFPDVLFVDQGLFVCV